MKPFFNFAPGIEDALNQRAQKINDLYSKFQTAVEQKQQEKQLNILTQAEEEGIDLWAGVDTQWLQSVDTRQQLVEQWTDDTPEKLAIIQNKLLEANLDEIKENVEQAEYIQQKLRNVNISDLQQKNGDILKLFSETAEIDNQLNRIRERQAAHSRYVMIERIQMAERAVIESLQQIDQVSSPNSTETREKTQAELAKAIAEMHSLLEEAESLPSPHIGGNYAETAISPSTEDEYGVHINKFRKQLDEHKANNDLILSRQTSKPNRKRGKETHFLLIVEKFDKHIVNWINIAKSPNSGNINPELVEIEEDIKEYDKTTKEGSDIGQLLIRELVQVWRYRIAMVYSMSGQLEKYSREINAAQLSTESEVVGTNKKKSAEGNTASALGVLERNLHDLGIRIETLPPEVCALLQPDIEQTIQKFVTAFQAIPKQKEKDLSNQSRYFWNRNGATTVDYADYRTEIERVIDQQRARVKDRAAGWIAAMRPIAFQ